MTFARRALLSTSAVLPTVPDPNVGWWKFFEHDGQPSVPDALGLKPNLTMESYDSGRWTTEGGKAAYHFSGNSGDTSSTGIFDHGIDSGPFTLAIQCNPRNLNFSGAPIMVSCYTGGPAINGNMGGFIGMVWSGSFPSNIPLVLNALNWIILRRSLPSNVVYDIFHNNLKSTVFTSGISLNFPSSGVAVGGAVNSFAELAAVEQRFYDVALTDQECFDLMTLP